MKKLLCYVLLICAFLGISDVAHSDTNPGAKPESAVITYVEKVRVTKTYDNPQHWTDRSRISYAQRRIPATRNTIVAEDGWKIDVDSVFVNLITRGSPAHTHFRAYDVSELGFKYEADFRAIVDRWEALVYGYLHIKFTQYKIDEKISVSPAIPFSDEISGSFVIPGDDVAPISVEVKMSDGTTIVIDKEGTYGGIEYRYAPDKKTRYFEGLRPHSL